MRIAPCVVVGLASLALAACSKKEPEPAPAPPAAPTVNLSYSEMKPTAGYPLKTCVTCGTDLHAGGKTPYAIAFKAYEIQLCCKDCLKEFAKDPEGYTRKVNPKAMFDR